MSRISSCLMGAYCAYRRTSCLSPSQTRHGMKQSAERQLLPRATWPQSHTLRCLRGINDVLSHRNRGLKVLIFSKLVAYSVYTHQGSPRNSQNAILITAVKHYAIITSHKPQPSLGSSIIQCCTCARTFLDLRGRHHQKRPCPDPCKEIAGIIGA